MRSLLAGVITVSLLGIFALSCSPSYEQRGDSAYKLSKKVQGDEQRLQLKTAYYMYQKAMKNHPDKITDKLRDRFIEMTLVRASMVLNEGSAEMDALPLYVADIDSYMTQNVSAGLHQQYAQLLLQMADSTYARGDLNDAIALIDKAGKVAADPAVILQKKSELVGGVAQENFETAQAEFKEGTENKDPEALLRAEYYVLAAMTIDSSFAGAAELLSKIRQENKATYSAYKRVIQNYTDTVLFRKVNKYDIFLAVPAMQVKGGSVVMSVNMYNYSWNPLRMKSENFFIVDQNGTRYPAAVTAITPEFLDQEHEVKLQLKFQNPGSTITKLIYENGEHFTEKAFM